MKIKFEEFQIGWIQNLEAFKVVKYKKFQIESKFTELEIFK